MLVSRIVTTVLTGVAAIAVATVTAHAGAGNALTGEGAVIMADSHPGENTPVGSNPWDEPGSGLADRAMSNPWD